MFIFHIGTICNDVMKEIEKLFIGNAKCYAIKLCEEWEILHKVMSISKDCLLRTKQIRWLIAKEEIIVS